MNDYRCPCWVLLLVAICQEDNDLTSWALDSGVGHSGHIGHSGHSGEPTQSFRIALCWFHSVVAHCGGELNCVDRIELCCAELNCVVQLCRQIVFKVLFARRPCRLHSVTSTSQHQRHCPPNIGLWIKNWRDVTEKCRKERLLACSRIYAQCKTSALQILSWMTFWRFQAQYGGKTAN